MQGMTLRKYGVQTTINFELYEVDGVDFRVNAVHAAGDLTIMKNEGAEANTANGFADEGKGYSITLTATEMQAARIVLYLVDQTATKVWLDKSIAIETYGNTSAMHEFDLDSPLTVLLIQAGLATSAEISGLNNVSSADILQTVLTEAYAVDGSEATLSQLLYMMWSMMNSLGFVLTTGTSRKLDGSASAMTFTIDDADNPTDINRTT